MKLMQMRTLFSSLAKSILALTVLCPTAFAGAQTTATAQADTATTPTEVYEKLTTQALIAGKVPGVKFQYNVSYLAPDRQEKADLYLPINRPENTRSPAIVIIHGGGWSGGIKDARRELQLGTTFARAGYVALSIDYILDAENRWPQNVHDCKNAVRWLRKNADRLQIDAENIGVIGGSAGGHLSLMVAYTPSVPELTPQQPYPGIRDDVKAVVNLYGITDLEMKRIRSKPGRKPGPAWGYTLLNSEQEQDASQWKLGSPIHHVTSSTPPTMTLHGDADVTVDVEHAQVLDERLEAAGVEHQLTIFPGAPHSFLLHDRRLPRDLRPDVLEFFDKHLK